MNNIGDTIFNIGRMDALASQDSPVHRIDPRAKIAAAILFIVTVISFDRYAVWALLPFFVYPVALISFGGLPAAELFRRALALAPLAILIGLFNPVIDRHVIFHIGPLGVTGGWASLMSIVLRFILTALAALVLIASTGMNTVCSALSRIGVPRPFVVQLLLFYRYAFVLGDEADRLARARSLRSFGKRGMGFGPFISMIGNLLLRTFDRAERIYRAMLCRGFDGEIRLLRSLRMRVSDVAFTAAWALAFAILRSFDMPTAIGSAITRIFP